MLSDELQPGAGQLTQASEEWVVDVTSLVYDVYGAANTASAAAAALGLQSMAFQDPRNVNITNGSAIWDVLRVDRQPQEPTDAVPLAYAQSALVASGLPFTEPGDLLVYRSPMQATVIHKGAAADGQVFRRDFSWVNAPSAGGFPPNVIATDYVVAVGPIEHPTPHDQWFPTLAAYNTWVADKRVLASLTILPNGFTANATGDLNLPSTFSGGIVILGQPDTFDIGVSSNPVSKLTLIGRDCYLSSNLVSLFLDFDLTNCGGAIDQWSLQADSNATRRRWLGDGCDFQIDTVWIDCAGNPNVVYEVYGSKLDIREWGWEFSGTLITQMSFRFQDSDVVIDTVDDLGNTTYDTTRFAFTNSNLYIASELDSARFNSVFVGVNSHLHFASGIVYDNGGSSTSTKEPLIRSFASNVIVPMTRFYQIEPV